MDGRICYPDEYVCSHEFVDGMYIRTMRLAKDVYALGATHKKASYTIILQGSIEIIDGDDRTTVVAPYTFTTEPGSRRIAHALEDCVYMTVAQCKATNKEEAELEMYEEEIYDYNKLKDIDMKVLMDNKDFKWLQ